jgi:nickel-dependent lactate racemase
MRVKLAYGKEGLSVALPDDKTTVVEPVHVPGLADEEEAIRARLREPLGTPPLRELVKSDDTVAVVFSDITRPQPRQRMLSALLDEIAHVPSDQIVLINALGTHRANTEDELAEMLGTDITENFRVAQHDAWDEENVVHVGRTSFGHEAYVNREYMRVSIRILTGFIEPHLFAGFSGGPKAVLPGVAGQRTILTNHGWRMVADPNATWGVTTGNPMWEEMREVALMTSPAFLLNVALNRHQEVTGVFAGDMLSAHAAGIDFVRRTAVVPVPMPFDIVITSNSGYPLDLNLYQAVKGMSAAAQVVKRGGSIILAAECCDGLPDHGLYAELLRMASSPEELLDMVASFDAPRHDQWEVQVQAQILQKARVYVRSSYLSPEEVRSALLNPCTTIEDTLGELLDQYGPEATICVLPEGPMTIPYVCGHA